MITEDTPLLTNSMASQAEAVKAVIAEANQAERTSIEKSFEAGRLLIAAKDSCRHGEWLPFCERAGIHERQARRLMQLASSNLKSDSVSEFGGIKGALEFLAMRKQAVQLFNDVNVDGAIDRRKLRAAIKKMDEIIVRFSQDVANEVIKEVSADDAFLDAIEGRGLPEAGKHLEITAKHMGEIVAVGMLWPSVEHHDYYYCAVMQYPSSEDATVPVTWTKRPMTGTPYAIDGIIFEPVWHFFETHMGAPASVWEFEESGILAEIIADRLDLPFLIAESASVKKWRDADDAYTADLLSSAGIVPDYPTSTAA